MQLVRRRAVKTRGRRDTPEVIGDAMAVSCSKDDRP
jgi:hypothetical protein